MYTEQVLFCIMYRTKHGPGKTLTRWSLSLDHIFVNYSKRDIFAGIDDLQQNQGRYSWTKHTYYRMGCITLIKPVSQISLSK